MKSLARVPLQLAIPIVPALSVCTGADSNEPRPTPGEKLISQLSSDRPTSKHASLVSRIQNAHEILENQATEHSPLKRPRHNHKGQAEPTCPDCHAGLFDISFLHDAKHNVHGRETDLEKQATFLSHIVDESGKRNQSGDAGRKDVVQPVKALPPNSRHHLTSLYNDYLQAVEDRQCKKKRRAIKTPDDVLSLTGVLRYDQKLYDSLFHQIVLQAQAESKPRGSLLKAIRKRYAALLNKVPRILQSFHQNLIDQRNTDKNFERQLQSGHLWWQKQLRNLRRTEDLSRQSVAAISTDLEQLTALAVRHDEEADQLRNICKLHADYRHHADQHLREQTLVRQKWQDTVYLICVKMIKDQKLVKLTETHVVYQEWYHLARKGLKSFRKKDKFVVTEVRSHCKAFLKALRGLNSFLMTSQNSVMGMLQNLKEEVDLFLLNEVATTKQHHGQSDRQKQHTRLQESFLQWKELVRIIVQNLRTNANTDLPSRIKKLYTLFEQIVKISLNAYLSRDRILQRMAIPKLEIPSGESTTHHHKAQTDPDFLSDDQFDISKENFAKILNVESRILEAFRRSAPYASLCRLWEDYKELQHSYEKWISHYRSVYKALDKIGLTLRSHIPDEGSQETVTGGLYDIVAVLMDQLSAFLHQLQQSSALFIKSNGMGKFATGVSGWLVLFEEAVEMPTNAVMKQISQLCTGMAKIDIDLITLASPHTSKTKTETEPHDFQFIRNNLSCLVEKLCCLSNILDDCNASGIDSAAEHDRLAERKADVIGGTPLTSCVKRWEHHIAMGINLACETSDPAKKNILPGSKLSKYSPSCLKEEESIGAGQLAEHLRCMTSLPQCLRGSKVERMPRDDAIRVQCVGEDDNLYVKRFHLNTELNLRRVMNDEIEKTFHLLRQELQKEKTASTTKLLALLEMEQELCELNMANQMLDVELQHREAVHNQKAPPNASLPQVLFDEIRNDSVLTQDNFLVLPPLFQRNVVVHDDVHYQNDYDKILKY